MTSVAQSSCLLMHQFRAQIVQFLGIENTNKISKVADSANGVYSDRPTLYTCAYILCKYYDKTLIIKLSMCLIIGRGRRRGESMKEREKDHE